MADARKPHETIYLQWYGDDDPDTQVGPVGEVTWCQDKINESDLEYRLVRKSNG